MAFYDDIDTSKKFRLLTRKRDVAGNEYIYLKGVASTVAGSPVSYDENGVTALLDTDVAASILSPIAVAKAAVDVSTSFGWYCIFGSCSVVTGTVSDDGAVFATSTGGSVDDAALNSGKVVGAIFRSANSGGFATVQLSYPVCTNDVS